MGLFGRKSKADDWAAVMLHVVDARRPNPHQDSFSSTTFDALRDLVTDSGGTPYTFVLEVRPEAGAAYQVNHQEKVPQSVVAPGLSMEQKIPKGIDLRGWVRVDDPNVVAIDWTSYKANPEAKVAVAKAQQVEADEVYARGVLAKASPKQQAQLRASAVTTVSLLADAVRQGAMTREKWEEQALVNLRRTLITQEQFDAAAASIDGTE